MLAPLRILSIFRLLPSSNTDSPSTVRMWLMPRFRSNKHKDRNALTVQPLPEQRPRALTLPLQNTLIEQYQYKFSGFVKEKVLVPQLTSTQEQSALFTRLPPEIRRIIWQFLLGNSRLHIVRNRGRLSAIQCRDNLDLSLSIDTCPHKHVIMHGPPCRTVVYYYKKDDLGHGYADFLSVSKTCRLM